MDKVISQAFQDVVTGKLIDHSAISSVAILRDADLWDLFTAAGRIRDHFRGRRVGLCSIVNAKSGMCGEDCSYCAQSSHHVTNAPVFPFISVDRIAEAAEVAKKNGAKWFSIVTSGRGIDSPQELEIAAEGIRRIQETGLSPCASLGTLRKEQFAYLKAAGLRRYHHNIETSREYFPRICSTHSFDERLEVISHAQSLGISLCSGGILGMGESLQDRISMAFTLRELKVDSVPINFLVPIKGTPLEHVPPISPLEALHAIALFRFILPDKEIRVCGGRGSALGQLHPLILAAGADGFMIGDYLTTAGLEPEGDRKMINDMGFSI